MKKPRKKPNKRVSPKNNTPNEVIKKFKKSYEILAHAAKIPSIITLIVGIILFLFDPSKQIAPDIHPRNTANASPNILPFTMQRKGWWPISNMTLSCGVDLFYFIDNHNNTGVIRDVVFPNVAVSAIDESESYFCDASKLIKVDDSGFISMAGRHPFVNQSTRYYPPLKTLKMCIWIGEDFRLLTFIPMRHVTTMFRWPATPEQHEWIEGNTLADLKDEEWIPKNSILGSVYGMQKMIDIGPDNKQHLLQGSLQCKGPSSRFMQLDSVSSVPNNDWGIYAR